MSAFYAVAYGDRIELLTDGAIYADDGTIIETREKVWRSDRLPMALACRGNSLAVAAVEMILTASTVGRTVDEALEKFADHLENRPRLRDVAIDGIIASVSDSGEPQLNWFTTYGGFDGFEPFVLYDVGGEWAGGPTPSAETLAKWGFPERAAIESLAECGADLFGAFRATKMAHLAHPDRPLLYAVGGHVDLTVVDATGARTSRLRTWPQDVPGRKIEPGVG